MKVVIEGTPEELRAFFANPKLSNTRQEPMEYEELMLVVSPKARKMIEAAHAMRDRAWTLEEWAERADMTMEEARNTLRAIGRTHQAKNFKLPWAVTHYAGRQNLYNWTGDD